MKLRIPLAKSLKIIIFLGIDLTKEEQDIENNETCHQSFKRIYLNGDTSYFWIESQYFHDVNFFLN